MKSFINLRKFSIVMLVLLLAVAPVILNASQPELSPQEVVKLKAMRQKAVEQYQLQRLLKFENSYKTSAEFIPLVKQQPKKVIPNPALLRSRSSKFPKPALIQEFQPNLLGKITTEGMSFLVNGKKSDTIRVGDYPTFTFSFPSGTDTASFHIIVDLDKDGIWDGGSEPVIGSYELEDNDSHDENPATGVYELTFDEDFFQKEDEPFNRISYSFLYLLTSLSASDTTHILWENLDTPYSVSGNIKTEDETPLENIIVIVESEEHGAWIGVTDVSGNYAINVPDVGDYKISCFDIFNVSGGLFPTPQFYDVYVTEATGGFDFTYVEGDAMIEGTVRDDSDNPISGIGIEISAGPIELETTTDASGYYSFTVSSGDYSVRLDPETVIPTFMLKEEVHTTVNPGETVTIDFNLYRTDSEITGKVYVDDIPTPDVEVSAWSPIYGFTVANTDENGDYVLSVKADSVERYWVGVTDEDYEEGYVQWENHWNIAAGSTGIDIHLISVTGGLFGAFINNETGDTIRNEYDLFICAEDMDTHHEFYWGPDPETGEYTLYLPNGTYLISAGGPNFRYSQLDTIEITGEMIHYDVYLDPISVNSAIEGYIYDSESNSPISGAYIQVWNEFFFQDTYSDGSGFYHIDLPSGDYSITVDAAGYNPYNDWFSVAEGETRTMDIYLSPSSEVIFDGHVYDNENNPIEGAEVHVRNMFSHFFTLTDNSGYFRIPLPNGDYMVDVLAAGYYPVIDDPLSIYDTWITRDYYLNPIPIEGAIEGIITDAETSEPIDSAHVFLKGITDTLLVLHQVSEVDGTFKFEVPNGKYFLRVDHEDYVTFVSDTIEVDNDTVNVNVQLEKPDGTVRGMVYDNDTGNGIPEALVTVTDLATGMILPTITDPNGYYEIPLKNGYYIITAVARGYFPSEPDTFQIADSDVTIDIGLTPREWAEIIPPRIIAVEDVPHDQGRWVRLTFFGGSNHGEPFGGWSIWRLRTFEPTEHITDPYLYSMDFIDFIPFHGDTVYSVVVPTLIDSNAYTSESGNYWSTFIVSGHLSWDMYWWFDSRPASGYSVDNIIPHVPANPSLSVSSEGITITWDPVPDEDLAFYAVFKSTTSGSYTDNPAYMTTEGFVTDTEVESGQTYYYTIVAVDANGNVSDPSEEVNVTYTSIEKENPIPEKFALYDNFPNPFNPTTQIKFDMPEQGFVILNIYDLTGKLIKTLVSERKNPGTYIAIWDGTNNKGQKIPSGIYIYKLDIKGKFSSSGKMILMK
ncbi:MAG: carboxypeptidase regulatory-like domain-containing protein [Candidatus Marinimicrobia bacterium]|nr:carboxypeptidase regulatory-like domain-containing protein [Candidatus Neomarinimicrobiota bacterium]